MDWAHIKAEWEQYSSHVSDSWGRLTEEDLSAASGGRNQLVDCVLKRYKIERQLAETHVDGWIKSFG